VSPRNSTRRGGSPLPVQAGRIRVGYRVTGEASYRAYYSTFYLGTFETRAEAQRAIEGKRVETENKKPGVGAPGHQ